MKKALFFIIWFFSFTLFSSVTFSTPVCPEIPEMIDLEIEKGGLSALAIANTLACLDARSARAESTITDFTCPSWDFNATDRPHTDEILAYQIAVAAVFKAIDTNAMQYAQNLQCNRDTDPIKWQQAIKIFTDSNNGYASKYYSTCSIAYITDLLNADPDNPIIKTTETFPQGDCMLLARAKVDALHNLWLLLASNGVGKWFQNDKDIFLDEVKTKYSILLDKVSNYLRVVGRAVAKLDKYLSNTVR